MRASPYVGIGVAIASVSTASIFILWSESPPVTIALWRLAFATAILAPIVAVRRREAFRGMAWRDGALLALVGTILAAHFALWITSLKVQGVTVASSVILVTSHPLLVGLLSHFVLRERLTLRGAFGVVLGFSGVVAIGLADYGISGATLAGDLLAFLGGVMAGLYLLAGRRFRPRIPLLGYAFVVYGSSAAALLVLALATGSGIAPHGDPTREFVLFLALATIPQLGGHTLYNWSLRWVSAPVVSLSLIGEPVGASLLAWALLSQTPSPGVALGGALALGGIYLVLRGENARTRQIVAARDIE